MSTDRTSPIAQRVYALIFNGVTAASADNEGFDSWLPLSERERFAQAVYDELRAGNIEFRLGPLALIAQAIAAGNPRGYHPTCIEVTNPAVDSERKFVCGPDCPPPPARLAAGTEEGRCDGHCSGQWVDPDCSWHGSPRREVTP